MARIEALSMVLAVALAQASPVIGKPTPTSGVTARECLSEKVRTLASLDMESAVEVVALAGEQGEISELDGLRTPGLRGVVHEFRARTARRSIEFRFLYANRGTTCAVVAGSFDDLGFRASSINVADAVSLLALNEALPSLKLEFKSTEAVLDYVLDIEHILRPHRTLRILKVPRDVWDQEGVIRGRRLTRRESGEVRAPLVEWHGSELATGKLTALADIGGYLEALEFVVRDDGRMMLLRKTLATGVGRYVKELEVDAVY